MAGLRGRKGAMIVAIIIIAGLLFTQLRWNFRHWYDFDEDPSRKQREDSYFKILPIYGHDDKDHRNMVPPPPSFSHQPESIPGLGHKFRPPRPPSPPPSTPNMKQDTIPRTLLKPGVRYLSFLPYAGLTNQFMAFEKAAYVAQKLNRTLILPPIMTNTHDTFNSRQRWSTYFDLSRFTLATGVDIEEWDDVKPMTPSHVAIGLQRSKMGGKNLKTWDAIAEDMDLQIVYGFGGSERVHSSELGFSRQFLIRVHFVGPEPRKAFTPILDRKAAGVKDNLNMTDIVMLDDVVDRYSDFQDQLLFLSHSFKLKDHLFQRRSWHAIGRHLYFTKALTEYSQQLVERLINNSMGNGEYIAIHLRRGDIWLKCQDRALGAVDVDPLCAVPLERYHRVVEQVEAEKGRKFPVIVTSDTTEPEDLLTIARYGWHHLDHQNLDSIKQFGIFGPAMADAAILAHADVFIGTSISSMTRVAALRGIAWAGRKPLYPAID